MADDSDSEADGYEEDGSEDDGNTSEFPVTAPTPPPPSLAELVETGDTAGVMALLDAGADVNAADTAGETALHAAVGVSNAALVLLLLRHNAATSPPLNICGWTPLHKAAARGDPTVLRLLLEFGAEPRLRKADGATALSLAHFNKRADCIALLESVEASGGPDAHVFRPTVMCSLQLLCAVAVRKHWLQRRGVPVDGMS